MIFPKVFCESFVKESSKKKYVYGINKYGQSISRLVKIDGFIDDFTDQGEFQGIPIYKIHEIEQGSLIVSSIIGIYPWRILRKLLSLKHEFLDYFSFFKYSSLPIEPVEYWIGFEEDYKFNIKFYEQFESKLNDAHSIETYKNILDFRKNMNINAMLGYKDNQDNQYFEDFLNLQDNGEVFLDVGSYDGKTSLEFIKRCPKFEKVYLFDPSDNNLKLAKENLKNYKNVKYCTFGLSNKEQKVLFEENGSCSRVAPNGGFEIQLKKLDDVFSGMATFIKMDIEGGEVDALKGAKEVILRCHPRLAVAVYHNAEDLRVIPELVLSIRGDYSIYLRHYTEGLVETVMFFIPKNL